MGKRYYCDYCNKSFADNPVSRKTHLSGVVHAQNKRAHYDAFRDEEEILRDESNKRPCRTFLSSGQCKFGDRCQYSHLTNDDKAHLAEIVNHKRKLAEIKLQDTPQDVEDDSFIQSLDKWTKKRAEKKAQEDSAKDGPIPKQTFSAAIPDYQLAECLTSVVNPPPSLLPPTKEELLNAEYAEWG
ncbi:hypothetical protein EGW08_010712 [Elysia chlorotica]|uniref:Zinc finger matrin-type protein 5 n=1 Tax=Elysia chlorotica TaxID=188477 RepID=A0A433TIX4_ELYCH|nr:hypothetical protein EGW08_010712 [Elysia chlorotica]